MTDPASQASIPLQKIQQVVLLGAGHAHVQVLAQLEIQPLAGAVLTLVCLSPKLVVAGMVPGFVAGHYQLDNCTIALELLVQRSGIRWIQRNAVGVDAQQQIVHLDDGSTLPYDWLSVNTGSVQDRELTERKLPGAREHGLFTLPKEAFSALWPRVVEMGEAKPLRVAVIGAGADGVELALAARHRLPNAAVTLVCGTEPPGAAFSAQVQKRLRDVLKKRKITVLQDVALSLKAGSVQLGCGADLACDVPLLATAMHAPQWLADSGLALDSNGFLALDRYQRSTSHSRVFAAGGVSTRMDRPLARHTDYAVLAGPALANNLTAAIGGAALKAHQPPATTLQILACGGRSAVGIWRSFSAQGWWVWWLKDLQNKRFVARLTARGN
ncbi:MAG: FAD-dependent oxidoreductase [Rhodoferax sp.]